MPSVPASGKTTGASSTPKPAAAAAPAAPPAPPAPVQPQASAAPAARSDSFGSASAPNRFSSTPDAAAHAARAAGAAPDAVDRWIRSRWNDIVDAGVRAAGKADLSGLASDQILKQLDQLYKDDPGYNPAVRMAIGAQLRQSDDLKLLDSLAGDAAARLGRHLREPVPGGSAPSPDPDPGPAARPDGWSLRPRLSPDLQLSLDRDKMFVDRAGLRGGVEATNGDLKLGAVAFGSLDSPLVDRDRATLGGRLDLSRGPLSSSLGSTAEIAHPLTDPTLESVNTELKLGYNRSGVLVPNDRLSVSGRAYANRTFGAQSGVAYGAEVGATYTARDVLSRGDALSLGAKAYYRNDDLSGTRRPDAGVFAGLTYHF